MTSKWTRAATPGSTKCIGQRRFGGFQYWENSVNVEGSLTDLSGRSIDAQRELIGDGLVSDGDDVLFEFRRRRLGFAVED